MKIEHFAFEVSNLENSLHFYVDKLGFKVHSTYMDPKEHETLAVLEMDGGKLELIQVLNEDNQPQPFEPITPRKHFCPHVALQTHDIEKAMIDLREHGVVFVHGPIDVPGVAKWFYVCDPDQNVIEVFQDFQPG